jgi:DNA polymerase-3 subunit delta
MTKMSHDKTLKTVLADIGKGKVAPCYLLYGDEDYLIRTALQEIINAILPEGNRELNLLFMDGEKENVHRLCETLLTPPLIPGRKIVVLRDTRLLSSRQSIPVLLSEIKETMGRDPSRAVRAFTAFLKISGWTLDDLKDGQWKKISDEDWLRATGGDDPDGREQWLPKIIEANLIEGPAADGAIGGEEELSGVLIGGLPEGHCLIMTASAVDKRKKLFRTLSEQGVVLGFQRVKGESKQKVQMFEAAREFLQKRRKEMSQEVLLTLGRKTGFDPRTTTAELEKLVAYTGERTLIEERDVETIVGKTKEDSVFDLTSALAEKKLDQALSTLKDLLDQGVHPLVILAMIVREVRFILHAKILTTSGRFSPLDPSVDFNRFQRDILPQLQKWSAGNPSTPELIGQHPYVIYNAFRFAERYSREELIRNLDDLLEADTALKTSTQEARLVMEGLTLRLCKV